MPGIHRREKPLAVAVLVLMIASAQAIGQESKKTSPTALAGFPVVLGPGMVVGESEGLGIPLDLAVAGDGSVYVVDWPNRSVLHYDLAGRLLWKVGRRGRGPGEFEAPTRVTVLSDSSIAVYDQAQDRFTRLGSDGRYIEDFKLELTIRPLDNIVGLPDGGVAVSGTNYNNPALARGVHIFNKAHQHVRSFGPVPPLRNESLRSRTGAGTLSLGPTADLIYVPWYPYTIFRYGMDGVAKQTIVSKLPLKGTPDDAYHIETRGTRQLTFPNKNLIRPVGAFHLKQGIYLSRRRGPASYMLDAFDSDGKWLGSREVSATEWSGVMAYDPHREVIWVIGSRDDAPVLFRVSLTVTGIH